MFKSILSSKIFRYVALTAAVVGASSIFLSSSNILQSQPQGQSLSQSQVASQPQVKSDSNPQTLAEENPSPKPDNHPNRSESADMPSGKILKQLNLSPEQLQKLKEVRDRDRDRIRDLSQQSRQANRELRDLLASNESSAVIRQKHTQVLNLQQELQKQHFERMLAMRDILTPQQRSQLNEIIQKNRPDRSPNRPKESIRDNIRDNIKNRIENRLENFRDRQTL